MEAIFLTGRFIKWVFNQMLAPARAAGRGFSACMKSIGKGIKSVFTFLYGIVESVAIFIYNIVKGILKGLFTGA